MVFIDACCWTTTSPPALRGSLPLPRSGGERCEVEVVLRRTADLVMFGTAMLMGSSYPFAKDVLAVMSPLLYSASRYLVAACSCSP